MERGLDKVLSEDFGEVVGVSSIPREAIARIVREVVLEELRKALVQSPRGRRGSKGLLKT